MRHGKNIGGVTQFTRTSKLVRSWCYDMLQPSIVAARAKTLFSVQHQQRGKLLNGSSSRMPVELVLMQFIQIMYTHMCFREMLHGDGVQFFVGIEDNRLKHIVNLRADGPARGRFDPCRKFPRLLPSLLARPALVLSACPVSPATPRTCGRVLPKVLESGSHV